MKKRNYQLLSREVRSYISCSAKPHRLAYFSLVSNGGLSLDKPPLAWQVQYRPPLNWPAPGTADQAPFTMHAYCILLVFNRNFAPIITRVWGPLLEKLPGTRILNVFKIFLVYILKNDCLNNTLITPIMFLSIRFLE